MIMRYPFANIAGGKLESLNQLQTQYATDKNPAKADLMCGVYQTDDGMPYVLPSVKMAKQRIFDNQKWNHDYPSSHLGEKVFRDLSSALLFGEQSSAFCENRIASMQTLGASGACHMGALFLQRHYEPCENGTSLKIHIPAETWVNHANTFHHVGFQTSTLPYYDYETNSLGFEGFLHAINSLPPRSIIVLQVCGNNPTGCDPSISEWNTLAEAFHAKDHFAFLDVSYMGFVSGDSCIDCEPIRIFTQKHIPLLVAATYGKSFGLYGERVGHLCVVAPSPGICTRIESQMKLLARAETGAMPGFGSLIVSTILEDTILRKTWEDDLRNIAQRLRNRRALLRKALESQNPFTDWSFVTTQVGMFLYTGLKQYDIDRLRIDYNVYLQDTGRLSISGLTRSNIAHVGRSINSLISREQKLQDIQKVHSKDPVTFEMALHEATL